MEAAATHVAGVEADLRAAIRGSCNQLAIQLRGELGGARVSLIKENISTLKDDLAKQLRLIESQTGAVSRRISTGPTRFAF